MKKRIINIIIVAVIGASMLTGCGTNTQKKTTATAHSTKSEASVDKAGTLYNHENEEGFANDTCAIMTSAWVNEKDRKKAEENREAMSKYLDLDKKMYLIANDEREKDGVRADFLGEHSTAKEAAVNELIIDKNKYKVGMPFTTTSDVNVYDAKLPVNDMHSYEQVIVMDKKTDKYAINKDLILTFTLIDEEMAAELAGKDDCVIVNADGTVYGGAEAKAGTKADEKQADASASEKSEKTAKAEKTDASAKASAQTAKVSTANTASASASKSTASASANKDPYDKYTSAAALEKDRTPAETKPAETKPAEQKPAPHVHSFTIPLTRTVADYGYVFVGVTGCGVQVDNATSSELSYLCMYEACPYCGGQCGAVSHKQVQQQTGSHTETYGYQCACGAIK